MGERYDDQVKCRFCKAEINSKQICYIDSSSGKNKVYYCNEEHYKLQQDKNKYKPKKELSNGESNPRRDFLDFIQVLYEEQGYDKHFINWKLITSMIKNMLDENKDMKYTGMKYCLWYMKEIANVNLFDEQSNTIISLLPFYYDESKQYYNDTKEISNMMEDFKFDEEVVMVKKNVDKSKDKVYNEIDISQL